MRAQVFDIVSRERLMPFEIPSTTDFELSERGFVDAQEVLANPNILLYCLEPESQQAVFVKTPDAADILAAPFYYLSQFESAVQVLKVSYETLEQLADQVELDDQRFVAGCRTFELVGADRRQCLDHGRLARGCDLILDSTVEMPSGPTEANDDCPNRAYHQTLK